jgi:hypothetical protein
LQIGACHGSGPVKARPKRQRPTQTSPVYLRRARCVYRIGSEPSDRGEASKASKQARKTDRQTDRQTPATGWRSWRERAFRTGTDQGEPCPTTTKHNGGHHDGTDGDTGRYRTRSQRQETAQSRRRRLRSDGARRTASTPSYAASTRSRRSDMRHHRRRRKPLAVQR